MIPRSHTAQKLPLESGSYSVASLPLAVVLLYPPRLLAMLRRGRGLAMDGVLCVNRKSDFELVVVGGTPAGIAAALAAGRLGHRVALVEAQAHLGGMAASGLSKSDVEKRALIGGLFREFAGRVRAHYCRLLGENSPALAKCYDGYYYEPSVAEHVFEEMLRECAGVTVFRRHLLLSAVCEAGAVCAVALRCEDSGEARHLRAGVFVDATYEGDLIAAAGAEFQLGREDSEEFNESLAGAIYYDYERGAKLPGSTGAGDARLPAFTYRLCLTTEPENSVPLQAPPADYDRAVYTPYFEDLEAGRLGAPRVLHPGRGYYREHFDTLVRALSVTEIPNGKVDVNINPRPLAFPFPEENVGYIEGDWQARQKIAQRHRDLALGLLWFVQHDSEVPEAHRAIARRYQLPRDEFPDNGHFPWQLYVREGRRLKGCYVLTQQDVTQTPHAVQHPDVIAMGEFPIDSFPTRKKQPGDTVVLEGYLGMLGHLTQPYMIPYRALLPRTVDGLIVPGPLSATHVAYSSLRMEPTWMALGHAAGVAAHLALARECPPRDVPVPALQELLAAQGQVLGFPA